MTTVKNKRAITVGLDEPALHFWSFVTIVCCLGIVLFVTLAPAQVMQSWPRWLRDLVALLGIVAAPVGSLGLLFWAFLLWTDWQSRRSILALSILLVIIGLWSALALFGLRQSPYTAWRWGKYGAIAGMVLGIFSTGSKDRYRRTERYDRKTGARLSVTPWQYVNSIPFVPHVAMFLGLALLGGVIGVAAFGARVFLRASP